MNEDTPLSVPAESGVSLAGIALASYAVRWQRSLIHLAIAAAQLLLSKRARRAAR